jgi:septum formation protein
VGDPTDDRPLVVLGSASPARATLLRNAGVEPVIRHSGIDEDALIAGFGARAGDVDWVTQELARAKALDVAAWVRAGGLGDIGGPLDAGRSGGDGGPAQRRVLVVGADSLFDIGGRILGKARSAEEVRARWADMAGGTGVLVTGHVLVDVATGRIAEATCATLVRFGRPDPRELEAYIASGEPLAVAGSCTIDGLGGPFIDGVEGDHTNVIGLSLPTLRRLLAGFGVRWTDLWEVP